MKYADVQARPFAPFQPNGSLKPTGMGSEQSKSDALSETTSRPMSSDISKHLSDKPNGTTKHAQVANTCLPAGERHKKKPIFITGVSDTRTFLVWLRASCSSGLTAQEKGEKLMVIPSTSDGFRATISALRSLDGESVYFHTFTLPDESCVRLLVKKLGRVMPDSVVRGELEYLNIRVQGVMQLPSGRRDQDPAKYLVPTHTSLLR